MSCIAVDFALCFSTSSLFQNSYRALLTHSCPLGPDFWLRDVLNRISSYAG